MNSRYRLEPLHPERYQLPRNSNPGVCCLKNPGFLCECDNKSIQDPKAENDYFRVLKTIGKIRLGDGDVSNSTPGFLPLKYEQPG